MATVPIPNGVRAEMIYVIGSQRCQNVYHFTKGSPATSADLIQLWGLLKTWEQNVGYGGRSSQASLVLITCTALDGPGAPFYENSVVPPIVGFQVSAAIPTICSVAVKHTTGLQGRSYRGRTYIIGLTQNHLQNVDTLQAAWAGNFKAHYDALRINLAAGGWTFCIASMYSGVTIVNGRRRAVPRASGILTPVTASSCELGIDTQRHRKMPYQV